MALTNGPISIFQKNRVTITPAPPRVTSRNQKPPPPPAVKADPVRAQRGATEAKDEARGKALSESFKNGVDGGSVEPASKAMRHREFAALSSGISTATETRGELEGKKREVSTLFNSVP